MTMRARHDLRALAQAQRVRDVQTEAARASLDQALLALNAARQNLERAEARHAGYLEQWSEALAVGAIDIGAARYWPMAVAESLTVVETAGGAVDAAVSDVDAAKAVWRGALDRARAVAKPLKQARRRLDHAIDERSLSEAADLFLTQRRQP